MATISANVSKKELDAIREYANVCGETISNLIRKVLITDAAFLNFSHDTKDYDYEILTPLKVIGKEEDCIVLQSYNRIRKMLGIDLLIEV